MKHARKEQKKPFAPRIVCFALVAFVWIVADRVTKMWANKVAVGDVLIDDIIGLFELRLVHNTGAAWGIFSHSTIVLGAFNLVVCASILILLFTYFRKQGSVAQVFFLALVFAGGIGNAIDRIQYSYVVDFINAKFIQFPVFNVADIGVTCGIIFLCITLLISSHNAKEGQ